MTPPLKTKPIRTVLRWQLIATAVIAVVAGWLAGFHGALSAALGGLINLGAGVGFAVVLGLGLGSGGVTGAGQSLLAMFRAEAVKVVLIFGGLVLVLSTYKAIVMGAFFGAFVVTVIIFSMAFFVRDENKQGK